MEEGGMAKWFGGLLVLLAAAAALYLLVWEPQQQALLTARDRADALEREAAALRTRVADLEAIREQLRRTSAELQQAVAEKEKELLALRSTQDELVEGLQKEIADKTVEVERIRDQLRVQMVDEILFDSGEAQLKPAGLEVLRRVGAVLKKTENRRIEVQGHTDNVPIVGALAKRFPTNWELSAARATNVARFLQEEGGLDPTLLTATAYSEYQPRDTNETDEGRRRNRRIEILLGSVLPKAATDAADEAGKEDRSAAGSTTPEP
jgi:chemotaxis protein MotB